MPRKKSRIYQTLKPSHLQAIGRVAAEWSGLEFMFQSLIASVAEFDPFKSLVVTKAASINDWKTMLRTLVQIEYKDATADKELDTLYRKISKLQLDRNSIVHTHWNYKSIGEGLFATPIPPGEIASGLGIPKRGSKVVVPVDKSAAQMRQCAKDIETAKARLFEIVRDARRRALRRKRNVPGLLDFPIQGQTNQGKPDTQPTPSPE